MEVGNLDIVCCLNVHFEYSETLSVPILKLWEYSEHFEKQTFHGTFRPSNLTPQNRRVAKSTETSKYMQL